MCGYDTRSRYTGRMLIATASEVLGVVERLL